MPLQYRYLLNKKAYKHCKVGFSFIVNFYFSKKLSLDGLSQTKVTIRCCGWMYSEESAVEHISCSGGVIRAR